MTNTLKTPFGVFAGHKGDNVIQYRGIKYASVKDQIAVPELVINYGDAIIDATHFGPRAPAMDGCDFEQNVLIQCSLGLFEGVPKSSGTECLNLNITTPDNLILKPLPVMVFIHGGGFIMGANYWPQYDPSQLVKYSTTLHSPVIAVNINYRLAVLGNLTSEELRKAGYPGSNSLRDQRYALQWVKKHISGFGGDPENVTVFGESAGAAATLMHLFSEEPLFKRVISMSGTPIMLKPLPIEVTEMAYSSIMKELGLENATVEERIQKLTSISPEDLVAKTPMSTPLIPFLDGDIIPERTTFSALSSQAGSYTPSVPCREWCEELMIGDCEHDGNVFLFMGLADRKAGIASSLRASLTKNISQEAAEAVLGAYKISDSTPDDEAMQSIIALATDIAYYTPAISFARSFPGKTYYYNFNKPNPWDGIFKGCATHMLDAAFLFQNFNEHLSPEAREVTYKLGRDFIAFANGKKPWEEFGTTGDKGEVRVYGPDNGRRDVLFRLSEEGKVDLDALSMAWDLFLAS